MNKWEDKLGREININDIICYGVKYYDSIALKIGKVIGYTKSNNLSILNEDGKKTTLQKQNNILILNFENCNIVFNYYQFKKENHNERLSWK